MKTVSMLFCKLDANTMRELVGLLYECSLYDTFCCTAEPFLNGSTMLNAETLELE